MAQYGPRAAAKAAGGMFLVGASLAANAASAQVTSPSDAVEQATPPTTPRTTNIAPLAVPANPPGNAGPVAQRAASETEASGGLEDIVVTAQRRSENIQNVPIAISAVTAAGLERQGVATTEQLGVAIPALQFSRQTANGGAPFVRGVGSSQATINNESPVAVYIDDVYLGSPASTIMGFNNIASVEVLKGPQGTLFGRNATGGVIHIRTRRPTHEPEAQALFGYGSYDTFYGSLYASEGLTENVAMSFAASGRKQVDGYGRNAATGSQIYKGYDYGFRTQILWEPSTATSLMLTGDYGYTFGDFGQSVALFPGTVGTGGGRNAGRFVSFANPDDYGKTRRWGVSARFEHGFDAVTFRSISAYRESHLDFLLDSDGGGVGTPPIVSSDASGFTKTFSQELQLLSAPGSAFSWILGGFYYYADTGYDPIRLTGVAFRPLGGAQLNESTQKLNSYSGFGEASYEFLPATKITAGLRYTTDKYDTDLVLRNAAGAPLPPTPVSDSKNFSKVTYRAIIDTKVNRDLLLYASYSRGFKSGGFNIASPTINVNGVVSASPVIEPEVLDAYEVGFKSELFGRLLRLNVAAYLYDYANLQVGVVQSGTVVTLNAAEARIKGIDVDYTFAPTDRIDISGGVAILDAKYTSFPSGPLFVPNPANCAALTTTGPLTGGNTVCVADLKGNRTSRAPKLTFTASATYTLPTDVGDFAFNASWNHNSGYFWEPDNRLRQPRHDLVAASIAWTTSDRKYSLRVYGRNLLNEFYYSYVSESTTRDSYSPEKPRNYGVEATLRF